MVTVDNSNELDEIFLGMLINNGTYIYSILDKVTPSMLEGEANQVIYRHMVKLAREGIDISRVMLRNELINNHVFNSIGGDGYIDYISLKGSIKIESLSDYVTAIIENYKRRDLIRFSVRLQKIATQDSTETISKASKFLNQLSVVGGGVEDVVQIGDAIDNTVDAVKKRREHPGRQGITTGFTSIDTSTTGYRPGEVWFIGARPSVGKTSFLLKSLVAVAKSGNPALLVSKEMSLTALNERLLSMESGILFSKIRDGSLSNDDLQVLVTTSNNLKKLPLYIDHNYTGNESYIMSIIRKYKQLKNIKVVGIDYIQLVVERSDESMHQLGKFSRDIKLATMDLELTVVMLSQLNRKLEERQDKRPQMYDLRQAGYLEEDGDYMIGLYRDEIYRANSPDSGIIEFIIRKARNSALDTIKLGFDGGTVNIFDMDNLPKLR